MPPEVVVPASVSGKENVMVLLAELIVLLVSVSVVASIVNVSVFKHVPLPLLPLKRKAVESNQNAACTCPVMARHVGAAWPIQENAACGSVKGYRSVKEVWK